MNRACRYNGAMSETVFSLQPFPGSPPDGVAALTVHIGDLSDGGLNLIFDLRGDIESIRWPESCPPGPADELWRHTCFELFMRDESGGIYREFNFSPSGQWADYLFDGYRQKVPIIVESTPPVVASRRFAAGAETIARVPATRLPARVVGRFLQLGFSAVVESVSGNLSFWALRHPADKPDFHHRDAFACRLDWSPAFSRSEMKP